MNCKPNNLRVNQGRIFYNKRTQKLLGNNNTLMYSAHNEGKSVIAERFIKTLKTKTFNPIQDLPFQGCSRMRRG